MPMMTTIDTATIAIVTPLCFERASLFSFFLARRIRGESIWDSQFSLNAPAVTVRMLRLGPVHPKVDATLLNCHLYP